MVASELITGFPLPSTGSSAALASSQHQEDEKLWTRILSEVSSKSSSTLQGGTLIILGDNQSGKSSLLARLEKNESQGQRSALEYHFLNVQNDFRDGSYAYQLGTAGNEMTDQQADRILVQVRRLCLQLGAALIYTSAKNVKNIQVLYKYVVHRAFGFPFTSTAQLIERDSVFVPAGWDGEKKIEIVKAIVVSITLLQEGLPDADGILEPTREKPIIVREQVVEAEDEQAFLQRLAAAESAAPAAQKKTSILDDATDNKTPLSSFFSNLLKDKPNVVKTSVPPVDSAVQLDRILKSATGQQSQGPNESSA
ncbi:dynein light intermediate chain [Ostertagia ostertagi]